jgi:hypothetical protein
MCDSLQRVLILTIAVIASAIPPASSAHDVRYWVWQRDDPLDEQELAELEAQKIDTIYWQAGELENTGETWHWKARFNFPSSNTAHIRFVPVVRLVSKEQQPFSDGSITPVLKLSRRARTVILQLDGDAPDRLLAIMPCACRLASFPSDIAAAALESRRII